MKTVEALELCSNPSVKKHSFPMIHFTSWRTSHVRVEPGKWLNTSFPYSNGCQIINLDCSSMIFLLVSPLPHLQYHKASAMRTSPNFLQLLAFVSFNDSFTLSLYIYCTTCLVCSIRLSYTIILTLFSSLILKNVVHFIQASEQLKNLALFLLWVHV